MPLETLRPFLSQLCLWKEKKNCSKDQLSIIAEDLSQLLGRGSLVCLEGELGAGKSTFASMIIEKTGVTQPPEGSPSFAIVHEYFCQRDFKVIHLDFYRLKNEQEIFDAGIYDYLENIESQLILCEWSSLFSSFIEKIRGLPRWEVQFEIADAQSRNIKIYTQNIIKA